MSNMLSAGMNSVERIVHFTDVIPPEGAVSAACSADPSWPKRAQELLKSQILSLSA
jgi:hypothetical protein